MKPVFEIPQSLSNFLRPPKNVQNEDAILSYMARIVLFLTALVLSVSTLVIFLYWLGKAFDLESLIVILALDSSLLFGLRMGLAGKWRAGIRILIAIFFLLGVYGSLTQGASTTMLAYVLALILTGIFLGGKSQWIMLIMILAIHLPAFAIRPNPPPVDFLPHVITLIGIMLGISSLLWFFTNQLRRAIDQARSEAVNLQIRSEALEIANTALINEISERKAVENALRKERDLIKEIMDTSPVGICIVDAEGYINFTNTHAEQVLGRSRSAIIGKPYGSLDWEVSDFGGNSTHKEDLPFYLVKTSGHVVHDLLHTITWPDGSRKMLSINAAPLYNQGNGFDGMIATLEDITETKDREREQETFVNLATALRSANLRSQMLKVILEQTISMLLAKGAALVLLETERNEAVVELTLGQIELTAGQRFAPGEGFVGQMIADCLEHVNQQFPLQPVSAFQTNNHQPVALIGIPLVQKEIVIGALFVNRRQSFSDSDLRVLTAIAEMAASSLHRATLHEETERQVQHLAALHTIDKTITSNAEIQTTLMVVLEQAILQLKIDAGTIYLNDVPTQTLSLAVFQGQFKTPLTVFKPNGMDYLAKLVTEERQAVRISLKNKIFNLNNGFMEWMRREDFNACLSIPLIAKGKVHGVLELYQRGDLPIDPEWNDFVETLAHQTVIAIENASLLQNLQRSNEDLQLAYDRTLEGWAKALELRDKETEGHSQNVTQMTLHLAKSLNVNKDELIQIRRGALLHDIGKMGIPDNILLKPGPLTADEWLIMKQHPVYAYQLLASIPYLRPSLDIPYCHHERWDGSGYPNGLKGEQIPLSARIFSIVDVWEALSSDRPYRKAWSAERVQDYLLEQKGKQFDPHIVDVYLENLKRPASDLNP